MKFLNFLRGKRDDAIVAPRAEEAAGKMSLASEPLAEAPPVDDEARNHAKTYRRKGRHYYNEKRYDKAARAFRKASEYDPGNAEVFYDLGLAAFQLGHSSEAVDAWSRVMAIAPNDDVAGKARRKILMIEKKQRVVTKEDMMRDAERVVADLEERRKEY